MAMTERQIHRLMGFGALGASGFFLLIYAGFLFITRPGGDAGMDWTHRVVSWIGVGGIIAALIAVHVVIGLQLIGPERKAP